jgi:hypothetical protein
MLHYRNISRQLKKAGDILTGCYIPQASVKIISLLISDDLDIICSPVLDSVEELPNQFQDVDIMRTIGFGDFELYDSAEICNRIIPCIEGQTGKPTQIIFSTNGEIPAETPPENLEAFMQELHMYSRLAEAA